MPWAVFLWPTTDIHLSSIIDSSAKEFRSIRSFVDDRWMHFHRHEAKIKILANFLMENRKEIKFRIQQECSLFYGEKKRILKLISMFWDEWRDIQTVVMRENQLPGTNTVFCKRLPLNKYQYQVYVKKNLHKILSDEQRQSVWKYLSRNKENSHIPSKQLTDFFSGKSKYGWEGYFYIKEEKMLTPIYMMAQNLIHKIYKYERI